MHMHVHMHMCMFMCMHMWDVCVLCVYEDRRHNHKAADK